VIQHLSEENRRLKEELEVIKDGKEMGFSEGKLRTTLETLAFVQRLLLS